MTEAAVDPGKARLLHTMLRVRDLDKSLHFYHDVLGWRVDADITNGDTFRIVQLTPPGAGATSLAFGTGISSAVPGSSSHFELVTDDIVATRQELADLGVDVSEVFHGRGSLFLPEARIPGPDPDRTSYASYATFEDPDGNGWTLQEVTTRLPGR